MKLNIAGLSLIMILSLNGCSVLGKWAADQAIDAATGADSGVSLDANVGQAKTEGDSSVAQQANTAVALQGGKTEVTAQGPVDTIVNENGLSWWELGLIVLLAGWAIPSPAEMLRGAILAVTDPLNRRSGCPSCRTPRSPQ